MPKSVVRENKSFTVKLDRELTFVTAQTASDFLPVDFIIRCHPGDRYKLLRMFYEFSIDHDPVDEFTEICLAPHYDFPGTTQDPDRNAVLDMAIWYARTVFRQLGTPANTLRVDEEGSVEWDDEVLYQPRGKGWGGSGSTGEEGSLALMLFDKGNPASTYTLFLFLQYTQIIQMTEYRDDQSEWDGYLTEESYGDDACE